MSLFDSYLPLREELYLSDVHLKPSAFLLLMGKYCRDSVFVQLAFTFSAGAEIGITATFKKLILKVLRTDVALAKFGQICPFNVHYIATP